MKKVIFILVLLSNLVVFAQKIKVLDKETGKIIKNVTIFNEQQNATTISDNRGFADISVFKNDDILYFSHLSYTIFEIKKEEIPSNVIVYLTRESEQLDEVVLSVFKNKAKANRIAEQVAVLSSKDIQKISPQTSADLLAAIPGIKVQKSQFGGGSPVLRGMESNRVLLVVDGVRMNNAIYRKGHLQNSITVSPNQLDRTEVVFGPSSVIYGSDALGGVIHYYTKTPKLSEKKEVKSGFFSRFSTVNQEVTSNFSAELRFKNWGSFTSISYSNFGDLKMGKNRSHGFENWGKVGSYSENRSDNYQASPTINSDVNLQINTGYTQTDILQKLFIPLSKKTDLKINMQYSESSDIPRFDRLTEISNGTLKFAEWHYGPQSRFLIAPQLEIHPEKKWIEKGTITFAYQNIKESRIQRKFSSLDRSNRTEKVNVFSLNGDFSVPLTTNKKRNMGYGFEFAYNDVNSISKGETLSISGNEITGFSNTFKVQSRYPDGGSNYISSAVYVDYRQDISDKSTLNSGVRFTNTQLNATWIDQTFITLPETDISLNNSAVTATLGYVLKPNKSWQLNSVLSSGFRSPNIDDVGRVREKAGNVTVPNITLKPEFAYNAEIGIQKYFNNKRFRIGGNVYYTLLDNYIIRDQLGYQVNFDGELGSAVANQNKKTAYITGFTASYLGRISEQWNTSGFITYTKGKTNDTNEPMSSIPPLFGNFELNFTASKFEAGANLRFNSRKKITDFNFTEGIDNHDLTPVINANATSDVDKYYGSPSWVTLGVNGKYTVNNNWTIQGMITNILDEHYREFASGLSAPGRNFSVALTASF
ncbi:hemoglobin/transferrin/lactoferrin receptor protein [Lutibacter sp. Hel_I_33_5]|uniref:TonB-dependent receptor n=1 Tax=Lutibacter sp. Hel_I_33_5 TaxID=1566289 RepID=UPI0011A3A868|nr:TonB-dependent receptor [Lutibacter sp. Hel_I_33_5]TVZ56213.1 hemoglobin/transferrin/lactoferrin receptor protein [Lutibacter sp. Hel_I_33_5]